MPEYDVYKDGDAWKAKRDDASRASSSHDTQADAVSAARGYLGNQGGGELKIHGTDGKIRAKDTIAPGHDPRSTKG
ncbi:DUF2188 domain-containing protein [Pengzhenrongella phosphoraccumulans]|uniref:DUF2188 domain-containing protein n=1 Tax=Pengzhenrongella phosphoraccumulans TaxID=3114394 RepID=UPI00388F7225